MRPDSAYGLHDGVGRVGWHSHVDAPLHAADRRAVGAQGLGGGEAALGAGREWVALCVAWNGGVVAWGESRVLCELWVRKGVAQ